MSQLTLRDRDNHPTIVFETVVQPIPVFINLTFAEHVIPIPVECTSKSPAELAWSATGVVVLLLIPIIYITIILYFNF